MCIRDRYYLTRDRINVQGEGMVFANLKEVHRAYDNPDLSQRVELHARIEVRLPQVELDKNGVPTAALCRVKTTVGRALLSDILPKGLPFALVNQTLNKKTISNLINECYRRLGLKETVIFADHLMYAGFYLSLIHI